LSFTRNLKEAKESKVNMASGRWAFLEIHDPWDARDLVRALLEAARPTDGGAAGR